MFKLRMPIAANTWQQGLTRDGPIEIGGLSSSLVSRIASIVAIKFTCNLLCPSLFCNPVVEVLADPDIRKHHLTLL